MDKLPTDFSLGDVYIDSQVQFRQWLVGGALEYERPAFWLLRGATELEADDISQAWMILNERILQNIMPNPIGQIITTINLLDTSDWLRMDGILRNGDDYPLLMDVIPSAWKALGMFTLPAMNIKTTIGAVMAGDPTFATYGIGKSGGAEQVALTKSQMPVHDHLPLAGVQFVNTIGAGGTAGLTAGTSIVASAKTAPEGNGNPHANMPPFLTVYYYIRAR